VAWYLTGDVHRANDLVQSALVKAYLAWGRIRPGEAMPYTRRILVNERVDHWRRTHGELLVDAPPEPGTDRSQDTWDIDTDQVLVQMLRRLPDQQRRVVVLRYYCDLSERQVAEELGISTGAVKGYASRGLAALREHMVEQEWDS
jgi:RNA polymerase sigma-70 factor (sigma-E family)